MSGQPTEAQELFFDLTVDRLWTIQGAATEAITALENGDFDAAVQFIGNTLGVGLVKEGSTVWETLYENVKQIRDISNKLESEDN